MNYKIDHCDPFDNVHCNYWMKLEHCGRYLFAADILAKANLHSVLDLACAEGYGSDILASRGLSVVGGIVSKSMSLAHLFAIRRRHILLSIWTRRSLFL